MNYRTEVIKQNKRKYEIFAPNKEPKSEEPQQPMESQMVTAVDQLRSEREMRKQKILHIMKSKNFNLFKRATITNMVMLKDTLGKKRI